MYGSSVRESQSDTDFLRMSLEETAINETNFIEFVDSLYDTFIHIKDMDTTSPIRRNTDFKPEVDILLEDISKVINACDHGGIWLTPVLDVIDRYDVYLSSDIKMTKPKYNTRALFTANHADDYFKLLNAYGLVDLHRIMRVLLCILEDR